MRKFILDLRFLGVYEPIAATHLNAEWSDFSHPMQRTGTFASTIQKKKPTTRTTDEINGLNTNTGIEPTNRTTETLLPLLLGVDNIRKYNMPSMSYGIIGFIYM
jgi:hypothetical protein